MIADGATGPQRQRPRRIIIVSTFALLLVAQGFVSFAVKPEPYPVIRMPSFSSAASPEGTVRVTVARLQAIDADGSIRAVSVAELMEDFRFSSARPSYDYLFRNGDSSRLSSSVKSWLRKRLAAIVPGFGATAVRMCWQTTEVRIADASTAREQPCFWKVVRL